MAKNGQYFITNLKLIFHVVNISIYRVWDALACIRNLIKKLSTQVMTCGKSSLWSKLQNTLHLGDDMW